MKRFFTFILVFVLLFTFVNLTPAYSFTPEQQRALALKYQQLMQENDDLRKQLEEISSLFDEMATAQQHRYDVQKEMFDISEERRGYLREYADELKQERDTYANSYQKVAEDLNKTKLKQTKQEGVIQGIVYSLIVAGIGFAF
jgi:chromosome segregation ATPase